MQQVRRESADKIIYLLQRLIPVYPAGFLKYFRSRAKFCRVFKKLFLGNGIHFSFQQQVHRFRHQAGAHSHQGIVYDSDIIRIGYRQMFLTDNLAGIYFMCQEKGGRTVSVSPLITAQLMGAAPRYCGSKDA